MHADLLWNWNVLGASHWLLRSNFSSTNQSKMLLSVPITCKWAGVTPPGSSGHVTQQLQTRTCPSAIVFWLASSRFFFRQVRKKTKQTSCFQSAVACVKPSRPCLAGKSLFFRLRVAVGVRRSTNFVVPKVTLIQHGASPSKMFFKIYLHLLAFADMLDAKNIGC